MESMEEAWERLFYSLILLSLWIYFESRARPVHGGGILSCCCILACILSRPDFELFWIPYASKWVPSRYRVWFWASNASKWAWERLFYSWTTLSLNLFWIPGSPPSQKRGCDLTISASKWVPSRYRVKRWSKEGVRLSQRSPSKWHPNESRPGIEGIEASNELPSFQCIQMAGLSGFQWGGVHGGGILSILTQYSRLQIWFIKIIKIIKIKTWRPESDYFTWRVQISLNSFWIPGSVWRI